jgi:type I restriction enzyme, S subunit
MTEKQTVKFGDICREVKLTTKNPLADGYDKYIGLEHLDSGSLKIKRWGSIAEDNPSFTRVFKKGHVLFGKRRSYLKKAAIAEFDGVCSGDIIVMEPFGEVMLPELLPFIVQSESFWNWAIKTSSGSLSPRTKFINLQDFSLSYFDKNKQRKILAILNHVNKNINLNYNALDALEKLYITLEKEYTTKLFLYPLKQVEEIADKVDDGPFGSKLKSEHYVKTSGVRVIRLQNIQTNYFDASDEAYVSTAYAENQLSKHAVKRSDLLIAGLGDETYHVGRACLYISDNPAINKADCFRVRANSSLVLPEFFCLIFNAQKIRHSIDPYIQGITRQRINVSNLKKINIPVPPIAVQKAYVKDMNRLRAIRESIKHNIEYLTQINISKLITE